VDGILNGKRYLIHDRDPLFTTEFQSILASGGSEGGEATAAVTESECLRGAVCTLDQGGVSGPADLIWRKLVAHGDPRIRNPLPFRTKPPRFAKPADSSEVGGFCRTGADHSANANRWTVELLPPCRGVSALEWSFRSIRDI